MVAKACAWSRSTASAAGSACASEDPSIAGKSAEELASVAAGGGAAAAAPGPAAATVAGGRRDGAQRRARLGPAARALRHGRDPTGAEGRPAGEEHASRTG